MSRRAPSSAGLWAACLTALLGCEGSGTLSGPVGSEGTPAARESFWDDPIFDSVPEPLPPTRPTGEGAIIGAPGVLQFDLQLSQASLDALWVEPRVYARAGFGFREHYIHDAALHLKGFLGSFRDLSGKSAFRVRFDLYDDDRDIDGVDGVTLNNQLQDASRIHEVLGYTFYRAVGLPGPRTGFADVRVNGELWGLYLVLEPIDDDFLERWFDDPDGNLYDVNWFSDLYSGGEWDFDLDEDDGPADRSDLAAVIEAVQQPPGPDWFDGVDAVVDMDAFVAMMAADAMLGHWDGYGYNVNNFRIYCEPGARCTFMPWGIDQTFNPGIDPLGQRGELPGRCVADASCRSRFFVELQRQIDLWRTIPFGAMAEELHTLLRPHVEADPRMEAPLDEFDDEVWDTREMASLQADAMQSWLDAATGP